MNKRDYYDILGISPEATERELKKAYRACARKYHPDINPEEGAEAMFKLAAEAYEVLADSVQRAIYDQFGHQGLENHRRGGPSGGMGAGFESVDDIFAQFNDLFGDVFSFGEQPGSQPDRKVPQRGKDLRHSLELSFEEAIFGTKRRFQILRKHICDGCDGEGAEPGTSAKECPSCQGSGKIKITQGFFSVSSACSTCDGSGTLIETPCEFCEGTGFEEIEKEMKLKVPAGIEDGARLRIRGEGEPGYAGGEPGDLLISIQVEPSKVFERDGVDLHYRAPLSFLHAALGCTLRIPTLEDHQVVEVPAGCQFGATIRLEGKGVRHLKKKRCGDLIVHLLPVTPTELPDEHLAMLEQLADAMGLERRGHINPLDVDVETLWSQPEPHKARDEEATSRAKPKKNKKKKNGKPSKEAASPSKGHPSDQTISSLEQMLRQAEQALGGGIPKK